MKEGGREEGRREGRRSKRKDRVEAKKKAGKEREAMQRRKERMSNVIVPDRDVHVRVYDYITDMKGI